MPEHRYSHKFLGLNSNITKGLTICVVVLCGRIGKKGKILVLVILLFVALLALIYCYENHSPLLCYSGCRGFS